MDSINTNNIESRARANTFPARLPSNLAHRGRPLPPPCSCHLSLSIPLGLLAAHIKIAAGPISNGDSLSIQLTQSTHTLATLPAEILTDIFRHAQTIPGTSVSLGLTCHRFLILCRNILPFESMPRPNGANFAEVKASLRSIREFMGDEWVFDFSRWKWRREEVVRQECMEHGGIDGWCPNP